MEPKIKKAQAGFQDPCGFKVKGKAHAAMLVFSFQWGKNTQTSCPWALQTLCRCPALLDMPGQDGPSHDRPWKAAWELPCVTVDGRSTVMVTTYMTCGRQLNSQMALELEEGNFRQLFILKRNKVASVEQRLW